MDRGIKWNYTRVHLTWNFALCVILLFFSAAKCRKCALDWWLLHRGNCPNAIGCGDLHTWLRSSPKTCCYYWVAQGKVVSPTLSPENKAWSSWAIWVPGDCIRSNEFPFISQTFCFCLSQHNIAWWHHKDNCFPQKYLLTLAVSIHILKFLISCELVQSVVYFKSVCVFSSQARNLVSWMNPFSPIASCLFWNLPFLFFLPSSHRKYMSEQGLSPFTLYCTQILTTGALLDESNVQIWVRPPLGNTSQQSKDSCQMDNPLLVHSPAGWIVWVFLQ